MFPEDLSWLFEHTVYRVLIIGLLGLLVGSFLNVVIYRLPLMLFATWRRDSAESLGLSAEPEPVANLVWPRSFCPSCHEKIRALHLVPLLSFLIFRGRCARCTAHIPWRYPVVEALTGGLFAIVAWLYSQPILLAGALLLTATLVALAFIDLDTKLLPDVLTQPLLWAGLLFHQFYRPEVLDDAVLGAVSGYLCLWVVARSFHLITNKQGMGQGDVKLFAAIGAWLGWQMLPLVLVVSSLIGLCGVSISMVYFHRPCNQGFPFGPYLAMSAWGAFFLRNNSMIS